MRKIAVVFVCLAMTLMGDSFSAGPSSTAGSNFGSPSSPAAIAPPTAANWTITDAGANTTITDVQNGVLLSKVSGNGLGEATIAAPGASGSAFTITAHFSHLCAAAGGNFPAISLLVGDAGDNKVQVFEIGNNAGHLDTRASNWTNSSTPSTNPIADAVGSPTESWIKLQYTGTGGNFIYTLSPTGAPTSFLYQVGSLSAASFLAGNPVRIGFSVYPQLTAVSCSVVLDYWKVSQP